MRLSLPGAFNNIKRALRSSDRSGAGQYAAVLDELEKHLRETIRGEHTLQEFADCYCLDEKPASLPPSSAQRVGK